MTPIRTDSRHARRLAVCRWLAVGVLLVALAAIAAAALKVPPPPGHRIGDYAEALSAGERERLERKLAERARGASNQVVVTIFRSLEGESLEEFSYVAITDRKLAVIGDQGIHDRVGQEYWDRLVEAVSTHFRDERPRDGFVHAVAELGLALGQHFPRRPDDTNELGDEMSIG